MTGECYPPLIDGLEVGMTRSRQQVHRFALATLFLAFGLALIIPNLTLAADLPLYGGPGGNYFRAECPKGSYLVGLDGRAGAWVDRIAPVCAPWLRGTRPLVPHRWVNLSGPAREAKNATRAVWGPESTIAPSSPGTSTLSDPTIGLSSTSAHSAYRWRLLLLHGRMGPLNSVRSRRWRRGTSHLILFPPGAIDRLNRSALPVNSQWAFMCGPGNSSTPWG